MTVKRGKRNDKEHQYKGRKIYYNTISERSRLLSQQGCRRMSSASLHTTFAYHGSVMEHSKVAAWHTRELEGAF